MVVCHCRRVNDHAIRAATRDLAATVDDIADLCGAGSRCGRCRETIERLLDRCSTEPAPTAPLVAAG